MKIVFFSDIHGNIYAFNKFIEDIERINADKVVFCGDVFGYYYYPNQIYTYIREHEWNCVLGNHDKMLLDVIDCNLDNGRLIEKYGSIYKNPINILDEKNIAFIRSLQAKYEFEVDKIRFGVFHGTPMDNLNGRLYPSDAIIDYNDYCIFDYVILGHTHHKLVKRVNNTTIINPGSLGQQRDGKGCSYLLFDTIKKHFEFKIIHYDTTQLINDIKDRDNANPQFIEVLIRKSY